MEREKILAALTTVNLVALAAIAFSQVLPAFAQSPPGPLRGNSLEIVDSQGRLRASITIQPETTGATETVLFRLIHPNGQPSAKISASMTGAGLSFVGGDDESYTILQADGAETRLKMVEKNGVERLIEP